MKQFVNYLYYMNATPDTYPADGLTYRTVDLSDNAVGFQLITAHNLASAQNQIRKHRDLKQNKIISYFLEGKGDIIYTDDMHELNPPYGSIDQKQFMQKGIRRMFGFYIPDRLLSSPTGIWLSIPRHVIFFTRLW